MKILTLHVDYINFKPLKKALKKIADLSDKEKEGQKVGESLVVLTAVETGDLVKDTVKKLVENVKDVAKQVKTKSVVLYPYAHLSSNLASPDVAEEILKETEKQLKKDFEVTRAPFGYYKEFELKVKGHPLSELSREIRSEALGKVREKEDKIDHKSLIRSLGKSILDTSKLKEYDHRIIGQQMDLFSFSEVAPGQPFWHDNGLIILDELIRFWKEVHRRAEYKEILTPQIFDNKLWKISGHWNLYKENMFLTNYDNRDFAVKPMNCPGSALVYRSRPRSYKELPLRLAEMGVVHRKELSGVLSGLLRVIRITQDDAHIFCIEDQLEGEIINVISLFKEILDKFGFKYNFTISVRSKEKKNKYLGSDELWKNAETSLEKSLKKLKIKYEKVPGEAKFYGPSLDVVIKDSLERERQCSTLQLDFNTPERFELEYIDKDNKRKRPVMLHRVVYGSLERFIGILLEHTRGRLPTWLAPIQVRVLSFTDRNEAYARKIIKQLAEAIPNLRIDADFRSTTVQSKVKDAEIMRVPYIVVLGDKEQKAGSVALRIRGDKKIKVMKVDKFAKELKKEIDEKK